MMGMFVLLLSLYIIFINNALVVTEYTVSPPCCNPWVSSEAIKGISSQITALRREGKFKIKPFTNPFGKCSKRRPKSPNTDNGSAIISNGRIKELMIISKIAFLMS